MTSFRWKRKIGATVSKTASKVFEENSQDDVDIDIASGDVDWLCLVQRPKVMRLEDAAAKSQRLVQEGVTLAESERYWEASHKWDEALQLTPLDEKIYEMKAQAYMQLNEVLPALNAAKRAVELNALWWTAHETLGRTHLGLGEVRMAIKCFCRAIHLYPACEELWEEDLKWAVSLLTKRTAVQNEIRQQLATWEQPRIVELDSEEGRAVDVRRGSEPSADGDDVNATTLNCLPANYVVMRD